MANEINTNSNAYVGAYFQLISDIDLNGLSWSGIGHTLPNSFRGHFDGNNHTIDNLNITITANTPVYVGLFGYVQNGSIKNLNIIGNSEINIVRSSTVTYYVGSIAAYLLNSEIINCSSEADIYVDRASTSATTIDIFLGGICGYTSGVLSIIDSVLSKGTIDYKFNLKSSSTSNIQCKHYIGGVIGYMASGATLSNAGHVNPINIKSDLEGRIKSSLIYSGGVVGYMTGTSTYPITVQKCYNLGNLNIDMNTYHTYNGNSYALTTTLNAGGITGYSSLYNTLTDCYNRGNIIPISYAQYLSSGTAYAINNCYVAGILGMVPGTTTFITVANSYNTGSVPVSCATSGNGTHNYYDDAIVYQNSSYSAINCYYLNSCCVTNGHNATAKSEAEFRNVQMVNFLNTGVPGSGIWKLDAVPYTNHGYPIFEGGAYGVTIQTRPATDITGSSALLHALVDTNFIDIFSSDGVGFQYALLGDSIYTTISADIAINPSYSLGQLTPCSIYVFRAYIVTNGQYTYGDTLQFTALCQPLAQIDTFICAGESFTFHGQTYSQPNTYYQVVNGTTYTINLYNYVSRDNYISTSILEGESYYVNGVPYTTSGRYTIRFDPDSNGCDSIVHLTLYVIPTQVSVWQGDVQPWNFGDGSQGNPYLIENAAQLAYMANEINTNS